MRLAFAHVAVAACQLWLVCLTNGGCRAEAPPPLTVAPVPTAVTPLPTVSPSEGIADAGTAASASAAGTPPSPIKLTAKAIALPGISGHAALDYLVFESSRGRIWVPVGDTGSVDVFDPASAQFTRIDGFKSAERDMHGKKRMMGPSSGSFGEGFVYIGNRASSEVCAIDAGTLKPGKCFKLATQPDGVAYVASAKELWVTTPRDSSVTVLDASTPGTLRPKAVIKTPGSPEGYAVDDTHGLFLTNLEDKDQTLVIDVKTHKIRSTWASACGSDGPRGIAVDAASELVMVACTDHVQVLDGAHEGAQVGKLDTGGGVDNVEWLASQRLLYVGAATAAKLSVIRVDEKGQPAVVAVGATAEGARNAVVDASGNAYLADPMHGGILVFQFKL
jgi:DNA-binding beta-propeller fold protein YncE